MSPIPDNTLKTARWQRVRARQLAREPMCRECGQPAKEVDHVKPRSAGGAAFDPGNLQSLCPRCHGQKTGAYDRHGRDWTVRGCDADGYPRDPSHPFYGDPDA